MSSKIFSSNEIILGGTWMHNNDVIFDIENSRIGIAAANCSADETSIDLSKVVAEPSSTTNQDDPSSNLTNTSDTSTLDIPGNQSSSIKFDFFLEKSKLKHANWMMGGSNLSLTNTVTCFFQKNTLLYSLEVLLIFLSLCSLVLSFLLIMATTFFRRKTNFLLFNYTPDSYTMNISTEVNNQSVVHDASIEEVQV